MSQPLVSICFIAYNGEPFIHQALDSLLAQDYPNTEIIILGDIEAPQRTKEICQTYAESHSKINHIIDDRHRNSHEAAEHLTALAKGDYVMFCSDDDLWASDFITSLIPPLEQNPDIAMAYPLGDIINPEGQHEPGQTNIYRAKDSSLTNLCHYLFNRHPIPIIYGLYRTSAWKTLLPIETIDQTDSDVDNYTIIRFLVDYKIHCIEKTLFSFREKTRQDIFTDSTSNNPLARFAKIIKHQFLFSHEIGRSILASSFLTSEKVFLLLCTMLSFIKYSSIIPLKCILYEKGIRYPKWMREKPESA